MKKFLYAVYDVAADKYASPFLSDNDSTAIRDFEHLCMDESTFFRSHPHDYFLYRVASFDDKTCDIDDIQKYVLIDAAFVLKKYNIKFYEAGE